MSETSEKPQVASAGKGKWFALTAMMFAVAMTFIDQTIVSIAAPDIQRDLGFSATGIQWMVNAYLLALAIVFAFGGRLSDIFGHKRVLLIGIILFAVSSAGCSLTPDSSLAEAWMISFRALQGIGAALLFPAALAIVVGVFPIKERGKALALFFGLSGAFTAIGPILGGWLVTIDWRAIFWINLPVALIAIILILIAGINDNPTRDPIDYRGAILIALGMGLSVLGLQQAGEWGWGDFKTWACIIVGFIFLVIFVRSQRNLEHPLIKMQVFKDRAFFADNAVLFFAMIAFIPFFFFASMYAQISLGYSASNAGLYLMTFFAGFVIAAQVGGGILDKRGAKLPIVIGPIVSAFGFFMLARQVTDLNFNSQWIWIAVAGAGMGFLLGPASTDAVNRAINASYGEVTGITQTVRNYSSALGMAILGTVLINVNTNKTVSSLTGAGVPEGQAQEIAAKVSGGSGAGGGMNTHNIPQAVLEKITHLIQADFAESTQAVFYLMAAALVVAFLCALLHPGTRVVEENGPDPTSGSPESELASAD